MSDAAFSQELLESLRRGDSTAATIIFQHYEPRLIGLARRRLDPRTRQKLDPEDVVQSVFRSFFRRHDQGEITVTDGDSLWALLAVITRRKCANWVRFFRTASRDVGKEADLAAAGDSSGAARDIAAVESALEDAILLETLEQLMRGLNALEREVVTLSLQGYSPREVAPKVQRAERTVQLILQKVRDHLTQSQPAAET
jgi:RNA polymerase sigma-70 factor (ECF subfamily)